MNSFLFKEFNTTTPNAWKQKIQVDLKGADYNDTLLWKTNDGIIVKPFYTKEDHKNHQILLPQKGFSACQTIFVDNEKIANTLAIDALQRGATSIQFLAKKTFNYKQLLENLDSVSVKIYFKFQFLSSKFVKQLQEFIISKNVFFQIDIIGNLAETGNWFTNLKEDFNQLQKIVNTTQNAISVDVSLYQNAGANNIQQLAYALAIANEYIHYLGENNATKIHFQFAVGGNYFFEIAKLRAFRILWATLLEEYKIQDKITAIFVQPSLRNKTLYDYNVNMLRTTSECMSAILGGANTISNISYDAIYHKSNEFGERIARNQLLILQEESGFKDAQEIVNGSYYIESITDQLAKKALTVFKQIEKAGGFVTQLKNGIIQRKVKESVTKEQEQFNNKQLILLGSNFLQNNKDIMSNDLEIYPFVKQNPTKTIISPIIKKRLSEHLEKKRLEKEKK